MLRYNHGFLAVCARCSSTARNSCIGKEDQLRPRIFRTSRAQAPLAMDYRVLTFNVRIAYFIVPRLKVA